MSTQVSSTDLDLNIETIKQEYLKLLPSYSCLEQEGKYILNEAIKAQGVKIHHITSRIKEADSFIDKIESKRYKKPFEDTTDIVGLRVVCLFLSDIDKIEKLIYNNFNVILVDNKIKDTSNPNTFDYMSAHYIVKIKDEYFGTRYDSIKNISFEIQVRTISMDAWANISHFLEYKSEAEIPPELKRDFNALSGLFYVADTHFEMFYKERQQNNLQLSVDIEDIINKHTSNSDKTLNLDSLKVYLSNKFPERRKSNSDNISNLVSELHQAGYNTIQLLDEQVDKGLDAFIEYEKGEKKEFFFRHIGVIRMILALTDHNYRNTHYPSDASYSKYEHLVKY